MRAGRLAVALSLVALACAPTAGASSIHIETSVTPTPSRFGDVVHATLVVRATGAATVQQGFAPFAVLRARSHRSSARGVVTTTWQFDLQCLEAQCSPGPGPRNVRLTSSRVHVGSQTRIARFPVVRVVPRATARQVAHPERSFLHPTALPPPTYRFAPSTTRDVLFALAAVLVLVALLLVRPLVWRARVRAPEPQPEQLARALALVRASLTRSQADRRRALGLLSGALRRKHEPAVGQAAADLAWSEPEPDPRRMEDLVERIERGR